MRFSSRQIRQVHPLILQGRLGALLVCGTDGGLVEGCISSISAALSRPVRTLSYEALLELGPEQAFNNLSIFGSPEIIKVSLTAGKLEQVECITSGKFVNFPVFTSVEASKVPNLRKQFESSPSAGLVDCYELEDCLPFLNSYLRGYALSRDAKQYLLEELPKDSSCISKELDKLKCFCRERKSIELEDVTQVVGSRGSATLDELFFSLAERDAAHYFAALDKLLEAGLPPMLPLRSLLRYYLHLDAVLLSDDPLQVAVSKLSPGIFFRNVGAFCSLAQSIPYAAVKKALSALYHAELLLKQGEIKPARIFDFVYLSIYELPQSFSYAPF